MANKLNFTPYQNGMLVKLEIKEVTDAGIILPESHKEQMDYTYEVVAIGPECRQVKVGDWVLLNANGEKLNIEGEDYGFIKEHQIFGVFAERPQATTAPKRSNSNLKLNKTTKNVEEFNKKHGL